METKCKPDYDASTDYIEACAYTCTPDEGCLTKNRDECIIDYLDDVDCSRQKFAQIVNKSKRKYKLK